MAMTKQPTVTRLPGQVCLVCKRRLAVGELGYMVQNRHVVGRVHVECKPRMSLVYPVRKGRTT